MSLRFARVLGLGVALVGAVVAAAGARADAPPPGDGTLTLDLEAPDASSPEGRAADAPELGAGRTVLLMADAEARGALEEALYLELAPRGVAVLAIDAPGGETALERAANAQRAARFAGAVAAVWVETSSPGGGAMLRVVPANAEDARQAPLPGPVSGIAPRTFALVAESLLDELVAPPAAPVRVRVQVQVDAPGQDVTVTTIRPAPDAIEAQVDLAPATEAPSIAPAPPAVPVAPPESAPEPALEPIEQAPRAPDFVVAAPPGVSEPADEATDDGEHPVVGFGADLMPMVGTSSRWRGREIRKLSLNLGGGYAYGVDGIGLAVGFNLHPGFVDGVVGAAGFNLVGGDASGAMVAGGFNLVRGEVEGVQAAAGFNVAGHGLRGVQAAAGANLAFGGVRGAQLASGFNLSTGDVDGAQVSAGVNVATGEVDGVQIGLVNVSRKADFALGLLNVFYGGRFHVEASGDSAGFFNARVKNGGDHFHYVYSVGGRPFDSGVATAGFGLGGHAPLGDRFFLDVEGIGQGLFGGDEQGGADDLGGAPPATGPRGLFSTRVILGFRVAPKLALLAGASYDVYVAEAGHVDDGSGYARFGDTLFSGGSPNETIVRGWPSVTLGLQVF